jgi:hypothetical protein
VSAVSLPTPAAPSGREVACMVEVAGINRDAVQTQTIPPFFSVEE